MKKRIVILAAVLVLAALYVWRVAAINRQYPEPTLEVYQMGETVPYRQLEVVVTGCRMVEPEELAVLTEEIVDESGDTHNAQIFEGQRLLEVEMEVTNTGDEEQVFKMERLELAKFAWDSTSRSDYIEYTDGPGDTLTLQPGESGKVRGAFQLSVASFASEEEWRAAVPEDFHIRMYMYPVRRIVELK